MPLQEFDRSLFPRIQSYYRMLESLKQELEGIYSKTLIDKALYSHLQEAAKKEPKILFPTPEAIKFYHSLCTKKKLEEVILDFKKQQLIDALPTLAIKEGCLESARVYLTQLRHCQLKKNLGPGDITKCLNARGLLQQDQPQTSKKKQVCFKLS